MTHVRRLALAGVVALAAATLLPAQPPAGGPPPPAPPKALAAIPRDGFLVVSLDVAQLWDNAAMKPARDWLADQKEPTLESLLGVGPADLERVTVYLPMVGRNHDYVPVVLVTTRRPYNEARVLKNFLGKNPGAAPERTGNVVLLRGRGPFGMVVLTDERTLTLLPDAIRDEGLTAGILIAQLLAGKADGPLAPALTAAAGPVMTVGADARRLQQLAGGGANDFVPFAAAFRATSATLTADFGAAGLKARLTLTYATPDDARRAGPVVEEGLADLANLADATMKREGERGESGALAVAVLTLGRDLLKGAKVEVKDSHVVAATDGPADAAVRQLVAALPKQLAAARLYTEAQNNLKQMLLGIHNFHDANGFMPSDVSTDRKSAMSWRIQLLPYLEHANIYHQLDHQLPWDNPRNKAILEKAEMPKVFEVPGRPAPKGHTYWRSFALPKKTQLKDGHPWLIEGERGGTMAGVTDGLSNTIAIVEAGEAVPWYAPDVLAYDGKLPLPPLGEKGAGGFLAGMGDGSTRFVSAKTDEATLRAAITRNGGEVLTLPAGKVR